MTNIKPIKTYYNGYQFRSRLEARCAVFFDEIGFDYIYELEGYVMSDGTCYLPDFFLPQWKYYVEVKGCNEHLTEDMKKIEQFVLEAKTAVIIITEMPYDPKANGLFWFPIIYYSARSGGRLCRHYAFFQAFEIKGEIVFMLQDDYAIGLQEFWCLTPSLSSEIQFKRLKPISGTKLDDNDFAIKNDPYFHLDKIANAFLKARQARFEHGETPAPTRRPIPLNIIE